jgi:hypothetical protein
MGRLPLDWTSRKAHSAANWPRPAAELSDVDAAALVDKLQAFALGDDPGALTDEQAAAGLELLDRIMPDLHHVELTASGGGPTSMPLADTGLSKIEKE